MSPKISPRPLQVIIFLPKPLTWLELFLGCDPDDPDDPPYFFSLSAIPTIPPTFFR